VATPALVLAAGQGSRLRGHRPEPKPLVPFGPRRIIEWNLHWLVAHGLTRIWINLHHDAGRIRAELGDGSRFGSTLNYSEEPSLLGTAGAWKKLEGEWTGTSVVVYGDNVLRFDLEALLHRHAAGDAPATVAVYDPERTLNTGIAGGRAHVRDGRVVEFVEGGAVGLVNAGVYALEPGVAAMIGAGFRDFGRDVLPRLAAAGQIAAHVLEEGSMCLGLDTPESYERGLEMLRCGDVRP
jgi:NDP-sugar pyrophosphorylase family protein